MHLKAPDGQSLEIRIVGYEFPHLETEDYDSNWLIIEGKVMHPDGAWTFRDPCLLTYEAARLADWLDSVANREVESDRIDFLEPNLHLHFVESPGNGIVQVFFELESRPEWTPSKWADQDDLSVEFPVSRVELREAASSLRRQLARFPQRAAR